MSTSYANGSLAERLWSNPTEHWSAAEQRMLQHRERLRQRGVRADALQPEWCRLNENQCYLSGNRDEGYFNAELARSCVVVETDSPG